MTYKLIAADIDGTLVNGKSELTDATRMAIRRAMDAGILFVVSTGRPLCGVTWLADLLEADLPFITYNGAAVVMSKTKKIICSYPLSSALSREALSLGLARNVGVFAWVGGILYTAAERPHNEIYRRIARFTPALAQDTEELTREGADKVLWCGTAEEIASLQEEMTAHFAGRLNCHISSPPLLEFVDKQASKAAALEQIGALYGIDRSEMIAVGDGYNDVSMLRYAGLGVAMANAPEAVKDCADFVTRSHDENGVAYMIEKFIFKEENPS